MAAVTNPRITVELEAGAEPIRGSIEWADGRRQPFWGWLELIEELQRLGGEQPGGPMPIPPGDRARTSPAVPAPGSDTGRTRRRRRK